MNENIFDKLDFGPLRALLDNDDITDISFDNNGQIWVRSLTQGSLRVEVKGATPEFVEKLAFQCSNVMGTTFNNAKPFLDAESAELRLNFVHPSIATNGIAMVIRKTPAKIRLQKQKLLDEDYFTQDIHDILIKCVEGHCNIIVAGETGSGKTEFVKYLASHTKISEKIITIEDTLELHLDKIFPQRDIVSMKTNNVASYTDVLVTCMRQNPKWILLSEVRSAEAVTAVRNSISSGHNILSTIHADKASAIPYRLYSLMETDLDVNQFLSTIYRYIQIGVHIRAYYSKELGRFHREVDEVVEFYVDENNQPQSKVIYQKVFGKEPILRKPSKHLIEYLENQNIDITSVTNNMVDDTPFENNSEDSSSNTEYQPEEEYQQEINSQEYEEIPYNENQELESQNTLDNNFVSENTSYNLQENVSNNIQNIEDQVNIPLSDISEEVQAAISLENSFNVPQDEKISESSLDSNQAVYENINQSAMKQENQILPKEYQQPSQIITQKVEQQNQTLNQINQQVQNTPNEFIPNVNQEMSVIQKTPQYVQTNNYQMDQHQPNKIQNEILPFIPPTANG